MTARQCMLALVALILQPEGADAIPKHSKFKVLKSGEIAAAENVKLRLNVQGGDMKEGDPLVLWPCSAHTHELFDFADGLIRLRGNPNMCLNAEGGPNMGAKIITWPCQHGGSSDANEAWTFGEDGRIRLTADPTLCINVKEGRMEPGTEVLLWKCEDEDNHHHDRFVYKDNMFQLMANRDLHLNVAGGELFNSSSVVVFDCHPNNHEIFEFTYPENRIRLKNKPEMCVNAEGGLSQGSRLVIWPCHPEPLHHELFMYDKDREVIHPQMVNTLAFNVKGGNLNMGGEIILWTTDEEEL